MNCSSALPASIAWFTRSRTACWNQPPSHRDLALEDLAPSVGTRPAPRRQVLVQLVAEVHRSERPVRRLGQLGDHRVVGAGFVGPGSLNALGVEAGDGEPRRRHTLDRE